MSRFPSEPPSVFTVAIPYCDFENPTDFMCEINCENTQAAVSDEEIKSLIMTFGTSAVLTLTGLSTNGWVIWGY